MALHVRALTPLELAEALDDAGDEGAPAEVASDRAMGRVVVAGLWEDHGPVFTSAEQAARMPHQAWGSLMDAALRGLAAPRVHVQLGPCRARRAPFSTPHGPRVLT